MRGVVWGFAALLIAACSQHSTSGQAAAEAELKSGIVATVGSDAISEETVREIAEAQGVTPQAAAEQAIYDALLANAAPCGTSRAVRVGLARATLELLRKEAEEQGPPTQDELGFLLDRQWWEIDRPEMRRSEHVVVLCEEGKCDDPAAARSLAQRYHDVLKSTRLGENWSDAIAAVDKDGLGVKVQSLPPVALDGRAIELEGALPHGSRHAQFDLAFVRPLFELENPGDVSGVVKSESGYHVIRLIVVYPEKRLGPEKLREFLTPQVYDMRAQFKLEKLRSGAQERLKPETLREAEELTLLTVPLIDAGHMTPCGAP